VCVVMQIRAVAATLVVGPCPLEAWGAAPLLLLLDGSCTTRITLGACARVVREADTAATVTVLCGSLTRQTPGVHPLPPVPAPDALGPLSALAAAAWGSVARSVLAHPAIRSQDPQGTLCQALLHCIPAADLAQVVSQAEPTRRNLAGFGDSSALRGDGGIYLRHVGFEAPPAAPPHGYPVQLVHSMERVRGACPTAASPVNCSYVGQAKLCVSNCWEEADRGYGRALPRPFQELYGKLVRWSPPVPPPPWSPALLSSHVVLTPVTARTPSALPSTQPVFPLPRPPLPVCVHHPPSPPRQAPSCCRGQGCGKLRDT
jgi:hypothetical protein